MQWWRCVGQLGLQKREIEKMECFFQASKIADLNEPENWKSKLSTFQAKLAKAASTSGLPRNQGTSRNHGRDIQSGKGTDLNEKDNVVRDK